MACRREQPGAQECRSLWRVICSGEALPNDLQTRFFERMGYKVIGD